MQEFIYENCELKYIFLSTLEDYKSIVKDLTKQGKWKEFKCKNCIYAIEEDIGDNEISDNWIEVRGVDSYVPS